MVRWHEMTTGGNETLKLAGMISLFTANANRLRGDVAPGLRWKLGAINLLREPTMYVFSSFYPRQVHPLVEVCLGV